jgi:4-hydroxy-tetrahydrodipicolinate synthase
MTGEQYKGIFTIPVTPFDDSGAVDVQSLQRCIEFCVECRAHGLVGPVNASQFGSLTDEERDLFVRTMVEVVDHAVPVVAGVTGVSAQHAIQLALQAQDAGCDALIAMPPHYRGASQAECIEFFGELAQAAELPIVLQNYAGPGGTRMSAETVARTVRETPLIDYVKEETGPAGPVITEILRLLEGVDKFKGVMGGQGCAYLISETRRGACGNMPGCHVTDALVNLWEEIEDKGADGAREIFNRFLPLFNLERQYPGTTYKMALYKRGVIDSVYDRAPRRPGLDAYELHELDEAMRAIDDLLTCTRYPWQG